jgi:hypothetical protein
MEEDAGVHGCFKKNYCNLKSMLSFAHSKTEAYQSTCNSNRASTEIPNSKYHFPLMKGESRGTK